MTTAQVVEMSVTVNNNSPIQDYVHPEDHLQPTHVPFADHFIYSYHLSSSCCIVIVKRKLRLISLGT